MQMGCVSPTGQTVSGSIGLHTIRTDRFKTARVSLLMADVAHEERSPLGTLLMGVLQRGCRSYPSLFELNRRLDHLYGTALTLRNFLQGDSHVIGFTADMLDPAFLPEDDRGLNILADTLDIIRDVWLFPLLDGDGCFRRDIVESEKQNLCDCILSDRKDPRTYSLNRLRQIQCDGEPYGLSLAGTVEQVKGFTAEDVTREWKRRLSECRAEVFYVGSESPERVRAEWERVFSAWTPNRIPLSVTKPHERPRMMQAVNESLPVSQGRLNISWQSDVAFESREADPLIYDAAMVLAELFGVMQGNLLFANLRERLGLCYECDVTWESAKGLFTVSAGISSDCRKTAEREVLRLMENIQKGHLDDSLVELAKTSLCNGYRQIGDNPGAMESFWFRRLMWNQENRQTPEECRARLERVTTADVIRAARMLTPDVIYFLNGTEGDGEGEVIPCP